MNYSTKVVQVTNVSPSTTSEQMRTLFGFLGTIEEMKLFPPDDSPMPMTSRVCFVKFQEPESVGVSQHLTNTVFVDRALIVVPFAEGSIPDEAKALSLLAPANAVAGILPGGGLLPTPNPISNPAVRNALFSTNSLTMGTSIIIHQLLQDLTENDSNMGNPFGAPNMDAMAAFGFPGANMNPQAADQLLKFMTDPKLNPLAAGLNLSASLKADASNKEIEEAMKRVREAQSLISAAIEPGNKENKKGRAQSRTRSRSRRRRSRSRSRHRRTRSRSKRRSNSRNRRRSKSPRRKRTHSRDRSRRSRSRSRDRKKDDSGRRKSKTPPKSYSTARRSRSGSRRRKRSRSGSRSPKKSPRRKISKSPSPRRHKKDKKKDKVRDWDRKIEKERSREEHERSTSKKKKSKDKERERERKSDGEKGDVKSVEGNGTARSVKQAKVNGADDHHEEDMDVSD
ncbi:serine/arginine-rich splicing factor 11-like isoform X3 [Morone saxatilis]|uniref:serine/arginine-rich splicing factor 11-like isoform X3 n=1 Tax=Morone saxatilis TaxID=34816 RepID=UPI0015E24936|nr:serine/arginine-rich splicing factor 11-like isoform X3 [Morone saxatilis]